MGVVPGDPDAFRTSRGIDPGVPVLGPYDGGLSNGGELIELSRPAAPHVFGGAMIVVERVDYSDSDPWPSEPDGDGPSLARSDPGAYGNDPASWLPLDGGNPGTANGPVVSAGNNQAIDPGQVATLNGSVSAGAGGFLWQQTGGPGGAFIASPNALTTAVQFFGSGVYRFSLMADAGGLTGESMVELQSLPTSVRRYQPEKKG